MNRVAQMVMLALVLLGWSGPAAAATIYKWISADGTVVYGERPPMGVQTEVVIADGGPRRPIPLEEADAEPSAEEAPAEDAGEAPKSIAQQRREERAKKRSELREKQAELDTQCTAMRQQLAWVEPSPRVILQNPDGTTQRMGDDERLRLIEQARTFIAQNCQ